MIHRISNIKTDIEQLYKDGLSKGMVIGHQNFDNHYSFKLGSCTYFMAAPASGKTEWMLECLINLSIRYGVKHAIYTPETGNKQEIVAELISKYCWKPFYKNYQNAITEKEMYSAMTWLDNHFYIIDPEIEDLTVRGFYEKVDEIESEFNTKINFTLGDPFNEFKHDFSESNGRQDLYIEDVLGYVRKNAKAKNRHNIITTHCKDQQAIQDKDSNVWYYPKPTARDYAGGQAWFRKGLGMIGAWRPPFGLINPKSGTPYQNNEVHLDIHKAKPKGIGQTGCVVMYYEHRNGHYYDIINGKDLYFDNRDYRGEVLQTIYTQDVKDFTQPLSIQDEPLPF